MTLGVYIIAYSRSLHIYCLFPGEMHFVLIGLLLQGASVILESLRLGLIQIMLQSKGIKLNPVRAAVSCL